jgi:hypothetical protein
VIKSFLGLPICKFGAAARASVTLSRSDSFGNLGFLPKIGDCCLSRTIAWVDVRLPRPKEVIGKVL